METLIINIHITKDAIGSNIGYLSLAPTIPISVPIDEKESDL